MAEETQDITIDMREETEPDTSIYKSEFTIEEDIAFLKRQIQNISASNFTFGNTTQGANGTVSITGVGFTPSFIRVRAWYQQDGKAGESIGIATTASNDECYVRYFDGSNYTQDIADNYIIYTFDNSGTIALTATLDSIDEDGFTMTFANYIGSGSIKYQYECYK